MSEKKAIVQYDEFPVTIQALRALPDDHVSAIAVLSYAVSETNALRRIFLSQSHEYVGDKVIDESINIQKFVVLRTWSSKLFEIREFLETLRNKHNRTPSDILSDLAETAIQDLNTANLAEGYQIARDIRHEVANHYLLKVARKNLAHVHSDALCGMYIHELGGNDFFPLGEAVMFHGRLHRMWRSVQTIEARRAKLELWLDWCLEANQSFLRAHANFSDKLLFGPLQRRRFQKRTYWVPPSLVGHPQDRLTPTVFRKE